MGADGWRQNGPFHWSFDRLDMHVNETSNGVRWWVTEAVIISKSRARVRHFPICIEGESDTVSDGKLACEKVAALVLKRRRGCRGGR